MNSVDPTPVPMKTLSRDEQRTMNAMGNYTVLYYPHFQPSTQWLKAILLLVDEVIRIVPDDVDPRDSDQLKELIQEIPGCLKSIAPTEFDINIDDINVERMNKAFREIRKNLPMTENGKVELQIGGGIISVAGHVFLHQSKISNQIRDALIENNLLNPNLQWIPGTLGTEDFYLVPTQASNLILSYIADRIANRTGLDSVTDENISFVVNALDNMKLSLQRPSGATEGSLLSAIASINIPKSVDRIPIRDFKNLRDSYMDIRSIFKEYIVHLSTIHRLYRIGDSSLFENQIQDLAKKINEECEKYKKTAFSRKFGEWGLFTVCNLLTIATTIVDPTYRIAFASEAVVINFLQKVFFRRSEQSLSDKACQMLADLRSRILRIETVKALV